MASLKTIVVAQDDSNQRIDRYIKKYLPALSLSRVHFLFRKKEIKVNKKPVKKNYLVQPGETITCFGLTPEESQDFRKTTPTSKDVFEFKLPIVFEDDHMLVIDKPEGIAVHPGTGIAEGQTVIEQVSKYLSANSWSKEASLFKPSLVHRLDKDTSGLLLIAKTGEALRWWTSQFRDKKMAKYYYALVPGSMPKPKGTINLKLERVSSKTGGSKTIADTEEGKESRTDYQALKKMGDFTLLKLTLHSGRMHQIRAHLKSIDKSIAGDRRYGNFEWNRRWRKEIGLKRLFLHAFEIQGIDPKGRAVKFTAKLPPKLESVLEKLAQS